MIAKDIGEGDWRKWGREATIAYCEEDVAKTVELLRPRSAASGARADRGFLAMHWREYHAKAIARIQARGIPIDTFRWNLVQKNKAAVIAALLRRFDPSRDTPFPIYSIKGEWSYKRFEQWLAMSEPQRGHGLKAAASISTATPSGHVRRGSRHRGLHALRDSLGFLSESRLPIGRDGRNRPSLFPFATATGRNAHRRSPYNAHAGMRSFMLFPQNTIGFHRDWRTQEVGVAAARFKDPTMMDDYLGGDVYHALARLCGLTDEPDPNRWKAANPAQRERMKPLQLGINYGMGVSSLAAGSTVTR